MNRLMMLVVNGAILLSACGGDDPTSAVQSDACTAAHRTIDVAIQAWDATDEPGDPASIEELVEAGFVTPGSDAGDYVTIGEDRAVVFTSLCEGVPTPATAPEWEQTCPGPSALVRYHGESTSGSISYTIETPDGGTEQATDRRTPLMSQGGQEGFGGCFAPDAFTYISIQNERDSGDVTCWIERDGVEVTRSQSSGAYVIATCSD